MSTIGYYICVPFAWLVRLFYNLTNSYGVALILFTLVIKLIMLPFQMKSKKSMMRMSRVSGQMQELQKRYAKNQAKLQEEMQKLYEEEGVNPMSGCLWSLIPFPILIALYSIIRQPITHFMMLSKDVLQTVVQSAADAGVNLTNIVMMDKATGTPALKDGLYQLASYGQINLVKAVQEMGLSTPEGWFDMNYNFLGLDLTATPWEYVKNFTFTWAVIGVILIPILAGLSQFVFSKLTMKTQPQADAGGGASMKSMMYMMPLMSVYIAFIMPAALGVYWIAQSVFSLIQEAILNKTFSAKLSEEEEARFQARQADRNLENDISRLAEELSADDTPGAAYCSFENFRQIYHLQRGVQSRFGVPVYLALLTMSPAQNADPAETGSMMEQLGELIHKSLRQCDAMARYSENQYVLLISGNSSAENGSTPLERIKAAFYRVPAHGRYLLNYHMYAPELHALSADARRR